MRISCFVSVWILTTDIGVRPVRTHTHRRPHRADRRAQRVLDASGHFLWIVLCPAVLCLCALLAVMAFLRWSVTNFERDIASTFVVVQQCMRMGLALAFPHPDDPPVDLEQYQQLKVELLGRSIRLNENYSQAAFELRIGRLSCESSSVRPASLVRRMLCVSRCRCLPGKHGCLRGETSSDTRTQVKRCAAPRPITKNKVRSLV